MTLRCCSRWALVLVLVLGTMGADCKVGRQVVDESLFGGVEGGCEVRSCRFVQEPPFELPAFADESVCPLGACVVTEYEALEPGRRDFENMVLFLRAAPDAPRTLIFRDARFSRVRIELFGPVTLRIEGGQLSNVFVTGVAEQPMELPAAVPSARHVALHEVVSTYNLTVGGEVASFSAMLSRMTNLSAEASLISLDSSPVSGGRLHAAEKLELNDSDLNIVQLSGHEVSMLALEATDVRTGTCGSIRATKVGLRGTATEFGPCGGGGAGPVRLHATSATDVQIDGNLSIEEGSFTNVFFGARSLTSITAWGMVFERSSFCDFSMRASLEASVVLLCPSCTDAQGLSVCAMDGAYEVEGDSCPAVTAGAALTCPRPWPESKYPQGL